MPILKTQSPFGRVLITGVAGFIGSNLAARLRRDGVEVSGIDNLTHGFRRNIAAFKKDRGFKFVEGDCRDIRTLRPLIARADAVIHLAAFKIPRYGGRTETLLVNLDSTRAVLESSAQWGSGEVLLASTSDTYGKNPAIPFKETADSIMGPSTVARWVYAISKICDEHMAWGFWEEGKIRPVILRFFGAYGRNENRTWWGGPQAVFIERALRKLPLEIHGDGLQTRTFCYIDDLVDGIVRALRTDAARGEAINLGGDREITIVDLARMIWKRLHPAERAKIIKVPYQALSKGYEDVRRRVPDLSKADALLGYRPEVKLLDGLDRTIAWHRRFL